MRWETNCGLHVLEGEDWGTCLSADSLHLRFRIWQLRSSFLSASDQHSLDPHVHGPARRTARPPPRATMDGATLDDRIAQTPLATTPPNPLAKDSESADIL